MSRKLFIRNVSARDQLEYFIISGVSSLLLLRYYLYLAGYPQIGGGSLHISHMLWGGLLMLAAIVLLLSFIGRRLQRLASVVGGVGFGIFIDEVGKFITNDNNYFFRPSIGIIYAVFVLLYLASNFLTRNAHLTSAEYQINALSGLEEAVLRQMDEREQATVRNLLKRANPRSNITIQLSRLLDSVQPVKTEKVNALTKLRLRIRTQYNRAWHARSTRVVLRVFFTVQILVLILAVGSAIFNNIDNVRDFFSGQADYGHSLVIGQAVGTAIAAWFAIVGMAKLRTSRIESFEWFRRATLTNVLFIQFFIFSRIQFGAMPGFIFNLALLIAINFVLTYERRASGRTALDQV